MFRVFIASVVTGLFLMLFGVTGCASVDRMEIFQPKYNGDDRTVADFDSKKSGYFPHLKNAPAFEFPAGDRPIYLTLEQAVMLALENNADLHVRQFAPEIAGAFEKIERGVYDPELFAEFQYSEQEGIETSRATSQQFNVSRDSMSTAAGIRQRLPSGTVVETLIEQDRDRSDRTPDQNETRLGLSVTQALLQGFGPGVNLAGVRQAELDTLASIHELKGFVQALAADTEIAYWHFVLAGQEIEIFQSSLEIARQQRDEIQQQIEVGLMPETEAAAARAEVARRKQALIDSRSQMEQYRLRLLNFVCPGPAQGLKRDIRPASVARIESGEPVDNLEQRLELARRFRPDLAEARLRAEQGRLETVVTRNGLLPKLELFVFLGQTGYADSFSESLRALDENTYDATAGLRLSHYIGNRDARGRHEASWARRLQAQAAVESLRQIVELDVRLAANEVERAWQQISASAATRALQEEVLDSEKQRFEVGASTALLVAQAQRDLLAARIAEVEAVISYRLAKIRLYQAEGSLLDRRGISLAGTP
jgi:outer membrane protein TolC